MKTVFLAFLLLADFYRPIFAWVPPTPTAIRSNQGFFTLQAGGFGGGGGATKKSKQTIKLKPKAQWDRFNALKGATRFRVAVSANGADWLEVGNVKSKDDAYTALAVARQRSLIVDVSVHQR